jgi:hypothetical protein
VANLGTFRLHDLTLEECIQTDVFFLWDAKFNQLQIRVEEYPHIASVKARASKIECQISWLWAATIPFGRVRGMQVTIYTGYFESVNYWKPIDTARLKSPCQVRYIVGST